MQSYYVLTGAPGTGKSTLLSQLRARGFAGVDEPARLVLAEQRGIGGPGVPDKDPELFTSLMLSRSVDDYDRQKTVAEMSFFDRAVPDIIAYARLFGIDDSPARRAADACRYNKLVFFAPAWPQIYHQDDERKMTFEEARLFGEIMRNVYRELGYTLVDLPTSSPARRADAVLARIKPDRAQD